MKSVLAKQDDGTIQLTITIPTDRIQKAWQEEIEKVVTNTTIEGFRKGKAPKNLVEDRVDKEKIREEVLRKLLPKAYLDAIEEHSVKPIMNPKIHIQKVDDNKDWEFSATVCELPEISLNAYKDAIKKVTAKGKIIVPGKEEQAGPSLDEVVQALLTSVSVTIPSILTEAEVERLLSQLLEEIKRLGLSLDQYLASTKKTIEEIKAEYQKKAENDIKLEFTLHKIAEEEKIEVAQKEIDEALLAIKDETERKNLQGNLPVVTNILRQQKTLDYLKNL